jgi:hypothetical protein
MILWTIHTRALGDMRVRRASFEPMVDVNGIIFGSLTGGLLMKCTDASVRRRDACDIRYGRGSSTRIRREAGQTFADLAI